MTILAAGTSIADFETIFTVNATAGSFPAGVSESLFASASGTNVAVWSGAEQAQIGICFYHIRSITNSGNPTLVELSRNGTGVLRVRAVGTASANTFDLEYWNGSAWTKIGSTFTIPLALGRYDLFLKIHETEGVVAIYHDQVFLTGVSDVDTRFNSVTGIDAVDLKAIGNSTRFSAIIVADEDTRPLRYAQTLIAAQGERAEWTGAFGNVGGTGFSDSTVVSTDTADQRTTYTKAALNAMFATGWTVEAAVVSARGRTEIGKVAAMRIMTRSGTEEAFEAQASLTNEVGILRAIVPLDPDGNDPWTIARFNSAEFGVQSRAP
jgi:hypothetical protein